MYYSAHVLNVTQWKRNILQNFINLSQVPDFYKIYTIK